MRHGKKLRQQVYFDSLNLWLYTTDEVLESGLLKGIRHLALRGEERELLLLLRSEQVAGLESLEFYRGPVSERVCRALASNRHFGRLRRLTFRRSELGQAEMAALSQAPLLGHLDELAVVDNGQLRTEAVRLLSQSPHWGQLKRLSFEHSPMPAEAVGELVRSPMVKGVTSLNLAQSSVREAVCDLARAPCLQDLVYLNLLYDALDDQELEVLGKATHLPRLTSLSVSFNPASEEGIKGFSRSRLLKQLQRLSLTPGGYGTAPLKGLVESPACQQLRHLALRWYAQGSEAVAALTASPYLSRLTTLSLESNALDANAARVLAAATRLPSLRYLNLSSNKIGSEGAETLAASPLGKQLERLNLKSNNIPLVFREQLEARFGRRFTF